MNKIPSAALLAIALAWSPYLAADTATAPPASRARIQLLIAQLGDARWKIRETASAELKKIGAPARAFLESAENDSDPEIAVRARALLHPDIWQRLTDVELDEVNFDNASVEEILAFLAKETQRRDPHCGPVQFQSGGGLEGRSITLKLRNVRLLDFIERIVRDAEAEVLVEGERVILRDKNFMLRVRG